MIFIVTHLQQQQRSSKLIVHPQQLFNIGLGTANMGVRKISPRVKISSRQVHVSCHWEEPLLRQVSMGGYVENTLDNKQSKRSRKRSKRRRCSRECPPQMVSSHRKQNSSSSFDGRIETGTVKWHRGRSGLRRRLAKVQFPEKRNLVTQDLFMALGRSQH